MSINKIKLIKAEIDRLQETTMDENRNFLSSYHEGIFDGLSMIDNFIESLEEEQVSNDLEEAAHSYVDTTIECFDTGGNPCCYPAFIAGAEWQKEKMMEDVVDGEIYFSMDYLQYRINTEPLAHFHHGDKVKLIIIKEE